MKDIKSILYIESKKNFTLIIFFIILSLLGFMTTHIFVTIFVLLIITLDNPLASKNMRYFIKTLPISDKTIVLGRYMFKLIVILTTSLVTYVISKNGIMILLVNSSPTANSLFSAGLLLITAAIATPINYITNNYVVEQILYYVSIFVLFMKMLVNGITIDLNTSVIWMIVGIVFFLISFPVSLKVYKKFDL